MPARNSLKQFEEEGYYHLYNRGVEKRNIFEDEQDYRVFLKYLRQALDPSEDPEVVRADLSKSVELITYCLMPNHFHLLVKQKSLGGVTKFMSSINIRYSMYFNNRHIRQGRLFQGIYKAAAVRSDEQLVHLARYIHLNPKSIRRDYVRYPYSGHHYFVSADSPRWLKRDAILELLEGRTRFEEFISGLAKESKKHLGRRIAID